MNRRSLLKLAAVVSVFGSASLGMTVLSGLGAEPESTSLGTLRGTVLDAATGQLTPCIVTITDAAGKTVIERESYRSGFRSNGRFSKQLPAGPTRVRVTRGFETRSVEQTVTVPAGGETDLLVELKRAVDLRQRGWFSGDSHAHMIHGEKTVPVDFDAVALAAQAENLHYLSLAHTWTLDDPTPEKLETELGARSTTNCVLAWNIEAPKNYYRGDAGRCLGHCWTLGLRGRTASGEDAIRLLLQASAHDYESDKPSFANFESHQLIHAQGGAAFYSHPARWWTGAWGGQGGYPKQDAMRISNMAVELPLDTLLGPTFDGIDVMTGSGEFQANAMAFDLWCLLLNHGYRVAATASSDSCFDRPGGATPGVVRTYTYLGNGFSLPAVTRATTQGHTFVTSGPLLLASIDNQPSGSTFIANGQTRLLNIEAWPSGADAKGLTRIELLRNGKPVRTNLFSPAVAAFQTNIPIAEPETAWYCVRAFGSDPQRQRAITGAFYFDREPHQPPSPTMAKVQVSLRDADTGTPLRGSVVEVVYQAALPTVGARHEIASDDATLTIPGIARLRAEVDGYTPVTLSPVLDYPPLVGFITRLSAEDLLKWDTFEWTRALLGEVALVFHLRKNSP